MPLSLDDPRRLVQVYVDHYNNVRLLDAVFCGEAFPAAEISAKLNAEIVGIVGLPDIRDKLAGLGVEPIGNTSAEMAEWIRREIAKYGPVVKAAGIKTE